MTKRVVITKAEGLWKSTTAELLAGVARSAMPVGNAANDDVRLTDPSMVCEADKTAGRPQAEVAEFTFDNAVGSARTKLGLAFVEGVQRLAGEKIEVPWGRQGPCFASVVEMIGMDPLDAWAEPQLQVFLFRLSHYLTRATSKWGRKEPPSSNNTFIGAFRRKMETLPFGTPIPRQGRRAAWEGFAELVGLPMKELRDHCQVRRDVAAMLADGRLVLGAQHVRKKINKKIVDAARKCATAVVATYVDRGRPIPLKGLQRKTLDIDQILDEATVTDPLLRARLIRDVRLIAAIRATVKKVGSLHPADVRRDALTFAALMKKGEQDTIEKYRSAHPTAEAGSEAEVRYVRNEMATIRRAMKLNGWSEASEAETLLLGPGADDAVKAGRTGTSGDRFYDASMERWRSLLAGMADIACSSLTFAQRVGTGINRLGISNAEFARRCGIPYDFLQRLLAGEIEPSHQQLHHVHRIEDELSYRRGMLAGMFGNLRTGRNNTDRKTITLSDGRCVQLKKYLRYLPGGALAWRDERLRASVEKADRTHFGAMTLNTIRQKEVAKLVRDRSPLDRSAPIFTEWLDLVRFKTILNDPHRVQSGRWEWRSRATIAKAKAHMEDFARWAMTAQAEGGLGLAPHQVSFGLFLNHLVINKYVIDRTRRFSHLQLNGDQIGPMLGGTEYGFLGFVKSLVDLEYGWLTQSADKLAEFQVIDVKFRVPALVAIDNFLTIEDDEDSEVFTVMDQSFVSSSTMNWQKAIRQTRLHVASLTGKVATHYKMIRDPHALVMPILQHESPVAVVVRTVSEALKRVPSLERAPMQHAREFRNAVIMLLLVTVVFRSGTLRQLKYRSDNTGHLRRTPSGWDVRVESSLFKNGFCEWLFGPTWRRRDYERELGDWGDLNKILDYYVEVCRPILLKGRKSDLLFPTSQTAKEWSHKTFNTVVTNWTRMWCVPNERFGTGIEGVLPWGPHCIRDIVATHIVLHFPGEERWVHASGILGTGIEVVKKRYAWVDAKRELRKVDPMYAQAMKDGFGDKPLW